MKKIFTIMAAMVFTVVAANAQVMTKFSVDLQSPAPNYVHMNGNNITQTFVITVTQGSVTATDTVGWQDPQGAFYTNRVITKNMGDTIQFTKTYAGNFTNGGSNLNYCVAAYLRLPGAVIAPNFDTTGGTYRICNPITVNFPANVQDAVKENVTNKKLNIYPNPAVGNTINLDYVAQNASAVEVNIFDLTGRKVMSESFGKAFKGQEGYNLDISNLNNGMYIIELRQDGIKATGQFIK